MKLHSPRFEKNLRREIKRTLRSSPELKREARRGKLRRRLRLRFGFRLLGSAIPATAMWHSFEITGHVACALAVLSLWVFTLAFFRAANLLDCLFVAPALSAFVHLPISNDTVFRWQWQKFILQSIYSFIDIAAGFVVLGLICDLSWLQWMALPPLTLLAGVALAGTAALLATRLPKQARFVAATAGGMWFLLFLFGRIVPWEKVWRLIDNQAVWINSLLPTSWAISLFQLLLPGADWVRLILLIPIAFLICSLKDSFARLQTDYSFKEVTIPESSDMIPDDAMEPVLATDSSPTPHRLGVTAIEDIVQTRQFLSFPAWQERGLLERWLWNWLTPRERVLVEFAFDDGLAFSAAWKKIIRNLLITMVAGFAIGYIRPSLHIWILGLGLFATICQVLAQVLATGRAFTKLFCSGVNIPIYAVYAVGFRELSRLLFKCSAVQLPLLIPFSIAATALIIHAAGISGVPVLMPFLFGFKVAGLLTASRLLFVVFAFSSGTNDSSQLKWRTLALLAVFIFFVLLFLALGGAGLFVPDQWPAWGLFVFALLDAYVLFRIYGWFYHTNRFDLMNLPRE